MPEAPKVIPVVPQPTDENGVVTVNENIEKLADWMKDKVGGMEINWSTSCGLM